MKMPLLIARLHRVQEGSSGGTHTIEGQAGFKELEFRRDTHD